MTAKAKLYSDPYIGVTVNYNYKLIRKVGAGAIGSVYEALNCSNGDRLACKVISGDKLKPGWQREVEKVTRLRQVNHVVQYHGQGTGLNSEQLTFVWILWDFVDGFNLNQYLAKKTLPLNLALIENLLMTVLEVLHACKEVSVHHGDLHEGNILISNPDPRLIDDKPRIWISDFGYGGSHNNIDPKDDYKQTFSIVTKLLSKLEISALTPRDRLMHEDLRSFLAKTLLEIDPTQGSHVLNPKSLLKHLSEMQRRAEIESSAASKAGRVKEPNDFLSAEMLGTRVEEWKDLFVPEFLAAQDLLSRNNSVLTGSRGCGKTMTFRRLTALMDILIGEPSGVRGSDGFVGFYVNCRDFVEAFPWLPNKLDSKSHEQLLHYFHLSWFIEILKTLAAHEPKTSGEIAWLYPFLERFYKNKFSPLPEGADVINHARAFLEEQKEECRTTRLGHSSNKQSWPFARFDFLDIVQEALENNVPWIGRKPIYLFLDDYTIPTVPRHVQRLYNQVIFKRRPSVFFKISTEAANSFDRTGQGGKLLELHHDFALLDLAAECIHTSPKDRERFLDSIFRPRINRHPDFANKGFGLRDLLGRMEMSNNQLAKEMRAAAQGKRAGTIEYQGADAFAGMWTSDIRTLIETFTEIIKEANGSVRSGKLPISSSIQNHRFRSAGGRLLTSTKLVKEPDLLENASRPGDANYGKQLMDIVQAFVQVSRYEMTKGDLVKNQRYLNPKQAFRIEVVNEFDLENDAKKYYEGLIRWHIFLQDWRGKSARGMITPRLYLNRVLLPYCNLTFSSHDNIQLTSYDLNRLLLEPTEFFKYWKNRRNEQMVKLQGNQTKGQLKMKIRKIR